jgi:hypothetical protein
MERHSVYSPRPDTPDDETPHDRQGRVIEVEHRVCDALAPNAASSCATR